MISTKAMNNELEKAKTWDDVKKIIKNNPMPTFGQKFEELRQKYKIESATAQKRLENTFGIGKTSFYYYLDGRRNPRKDVVIKMGLVIGATVEEINELLKLSKHKELYSKSKEDAVIIFAIKSKRIKNFEDLKELDEDLKKLDEVLASYKSKMKFYVDK